MPAGPVCLIPTLHWVTVLRHEHRDLNDSRDILRRTRRQARGDTGSRHRHSAAPDDVSRIRGGYVRLSLAIGQSCDALLMLRAITCIVLRFAALACEQQTMV
jgi:hypothetical protein